MKNCPMIKRPRNAQDFSSEAEQKSQGMENEFNEITGVSFPSQRNEKTFKYKSHFDPQTNRTE